MTSGVCKLAIDRRRNAPTGIIEIPTCVRYSGCRVVMRPFRRGAKDKRELEATPGDGKPAFQTSWHIDQGLEAKQTMAEGDQTMADSDQTLSDGDQTDSDSDQATSDADQEASDQDQVASDRESSDDADQEDRDRSTRDRDHATRLREEQVQTRLLSAHGREDRAEDRDRVASERDRTASERDAEAQAQDEIYPPEQRARRVRDRERAAADRAHAAQDRARAASDRVGAAMERTEAIGDRVLAAGDRAKLKAAEIDELTRVRRRGAGMAQLKREIPRARYGPEALVVAFVDVDGLKRINDADGHAAGDALLCSVADALQRSMRSNDFVMRYGGDEFVCVLPGAEVDQIRRRFDDVSAELGRSSSHASITAGFAELRDGDSAMDLIKRADGDLLTRRHRV
jgi:diguanylate cyclase (GGDEF)-like protein